MKKYFTYLILLNLCWFLNVSAQEEPISFKVKKEQLLAKAYFDNTNMKLLAVDKYGNPRDNKIIAYKLWIKGESGALEGFSNSLTPDMLKELRKKKKATKIFFTEIKAMDEEGHPVSLPDVIETWFPDCKNCENKARKR